MSSNKVQVKWNKIQLRVQNGEKSVDFYKHHFGFELVDVFRSEQWHFATYFLALLNNKDERPSGEPGSEGAHKWLWANTEHVLLALTENQNDDGSPAERTYRNGNVEPHRGFGHIAVLCDDVYAACEKLEAAGVKFQKKPDEGRMKGLAFALDVDGNWIEVIKRTEGHAIATEYNLSQCMLRVKNVEASLAFYRDALGMQLVAQRHFAEAKFSLYFLASLAYGDTLPEGDEARWQFMMQLRQPVLELTHNHGTETDDSQQYYTGSDSAFADLGFLVDDIDAAVAHLSASSAVVWRKRPEQCSMRGMAILDDPDHYTVQLLQKDFYTLNASN
jgi:lactoylglutathione lyase